jgi:hypothetical protein
MEMPSGFEKFLQAGPKVPVQVREELLEKIINSPNQGGRKSKNYTRDK